MLPVIGIIRVGPQSLSDHYLYVPAIGIFVLAVWGFHDSLRRVRSHQGVSAILGTAVVVSYALATAAYLPSWKNSFTLFSRAERLSPAANDVIENNLGEGLSELGRTSEAIPHYRLAISLAPQMALPHCSLGNALVATGDPYGAIAEFQAALERSPNNRLRAQCLNNLAVAQLVLQRADLAEQSFTAALQIVPSDQHSLTGRGAARFQLGQLDGALGDLRRALEIAPDPLAYYWLGKTLVAKNQREDAIAAFKLALAMAPDQRASRMELEKLQRDDSR
jgi:tetratricopeptide (TPR) repeat protein